MASSVFYVGEIGLNDYNFALNSTSIEVAVSLVPDIIGAIRSALTVRPLLSVSSNTATTSSSFSVDLCRT